MFKVWLLNPRRKWMMSSRLPGLASALAKTGGTLSVRNDRNGLPFSQLETLARNRTWKEEKHGESEAGRPAQLSNKKKSTALSK